MGLLRIEKAILASTNPDVSLAGASCHVYARGSDRVVALYADADLTVLKQNPVKANSEGIFDLSYLRDGQYRLVIQAADGRDLLFDGLTDVRSMRSTRGGILFEHVSELLSDTRVQYGSGWGAMTVGAGDFLQVCRGDHSYEVLAEDASEHDLVTPGGVKLQVSQKLGFLDVRAFGARGDGVADDTMAIQAALDTASRHGGGAVILPVGLWRTTQTLQIRRSVSLEGRSQSGGQRGGATNNHPVTIRYEGTGAAVQLGVSGDPCVNAHVAGFAIVAEPDAANYQNFVGFHAYDLRSSQCENLYVEGARIGYCFTGEGGAVVYVACRNLNAHLCQIGLEADCPTPEGEVWPFMQANTFGVREISECGVGIRLGGGQQNHSRIVVNAGEIGNGGIGIHVDGDQNGDRLTYQLEGQGWFENNSGGNIVMDAGTLYVSGDVTNSDNNVLGGYIQNGGRLVPLGRVSFDDYSIPFTGFSSQGMQRVWSFVDMGTDQFLCPLSGAAAQIVGTGAMKVAAKTRFGDGVQGGGSGGGLRVMDQSLDWTADWTLAVLVHTPTTDDAEIFKLQKNTPLSRFEIEARPGFVRLLVQDDGAPPVTTNLGKTHDNPTRSAFWVVLSYDAALGQLQFRSPGGAVLDTWDHPVPAAFAANMYDNFSLNGSLSATRAVLDEVVIYNRVLTPDEVAGLVELRTNVVSTLGMDPRQGITRSDTYSGTTDGTGKMYIPHGLLSPPKAAFAQPVDDNGRTAHVLGVSDTLITIEIRNNAGNQVGTAPLSVAWRAEL